MNSVSAFARAATAGLMVALATLAGVLFVQVPACLPIAAIAVFSGPMSALNVAAAVALVIVDDLVLLRALAPVDDFVGVDPHAASASGATVIMIVFLSTLGRMMVVRAISTIPQRCSVWDFRSPPGRHAQPLFGKSSE